VAALTQTAARVNEHNLREPLPRTNNGDELDRLTEVFNTMMARLDASFGRIREFTLHASHELKTPLTVVRGELESALQDPELAPAQRERCATQLEEVQRLTAIVDGLTLLTKADAGQVALAREPIRLDEIVRDTFADTQILAQPRTIQVTLQASEPLTVTGDRNRLRQLLLNLADNAVKYCDPAGQVTLALRKVEDLAEFTITNTGPGIPPAIQPRVFDRFFRGDASHNNDVEGCGLGLSIAEWIATAHGGRIRLSSEPGPLTTVIVSLPLAPGGQPGTG
jgi:signal transduction histidine kinase